MLDWLMRPYWKLWWWRRDRAEHRLTQAVLDEQGFDGQGKRATVYLHDATGAAVAVLLPVEDYETLVLNAEHVAIAKVVFAGVPRYVDPRYDHGHLESRVPNRLRNEHTDDLRGDHDR